MGSLCWISAEDHQQVDLHSSSLGRNRNDHVTCPPMQGSFCAAVHRQLLEESEVSTEAYGIELYACHTFFETEFACP